MHLAFLHGKIDVGSARIAKYDSEFRAESILQQSWKIVSGTADAGRAARYDVLRARVARSNIEPLVIQARNDRDVAMLDLKRILNIPVAQPVALATRLDGNAVRTMLSALVDSAATPDRASTHSAELTVRAREDAIRVAREEAKAKGLKNADKVLAEFRSEIAKAEK